MNLGNNQPFDFDENAKSGCAGHGEIGLNPKPRRSRKQFLKFAGAAVALAAIPLSNKNVMGKTGDWVTTTGFPAGGSYLSPVQPVADAYNAIGSFWEVNSGDGNKLVLELRTSKDGSNFGDWYEAHTDSLDSKTAPGSRFFGRLQFVTGGYVQYRLTIPAGMSVKLVGITFIDTSAGPTSPNGPAPSPGLTVGGVPPKPPVISRANWGANESLRYSGAAEIWPREYKVPKVFIVHHSETPNNNNPNPAAEVRSIYYYHSVTKGWGDIGYNYLVDWKGNIYEGRNGGDNVIGGHAYPFNPGSIGICMIGSFKTSAPPAALLDSLVKLISWAAYAKNINPNSQVYMIDRNVRCISGHRDVNDTTCPGDVGYTQLPGIRQRVTDSLPPRNDQGSFNVALKSLTFSPTTLRAGELLKVEAVITNTGSRPLESQDPDPGFIYEEGQTWDSLNFEKVSDRFRLAIDFAGNGGVSHPYRWGLGKTVAPGETVTVTGFIKMKQPRSLTIYGSIIHEYVQYYNDNFATTNIRVLAAGPNRVDRAQPRKDNNNTYFAETGHNLGASFRRYWEQFGGLAIFGFPMTEEFTEESPSEPGKSFTVQYFQRNRFEFHPEYIGTRSEVLLGLLGVQLTEDRDFPKAGSFPNTPDRVYFPETSHGLGGAFYQYWKNNGGLPIFGYPISDEFQERNPDDGKTYTVQYFERNRFEFHPENRGTKYEVLLGLLGTELCRRKGWL